MDSYPKVDEKMWTLWRAKVINTCSGLRNFVDSVDLSSGARFDLPALDVS